VKKYLLSAALAGAFCSPAYATNLTFGAETFGVVETYAPANGGPTISSVEPNNHLFTLTVGGAGVTFNAFTANPAALCSGGGCTGGVGGTEIDPITFQISGLTDTPFITQSGKFEAKYSGAEIGCAVGDAGSGAGQSDCFLWGNTTLWSQSVTQLVALTGAYSGDVLHIQFNNTADWAITPTITLSVTQTAAGAPEPSTWAMFGIGFAALGVFYRRRSTGRLATL
jgi:hypothetical protein